MNFVNQDLKPECSYGGIFEKGSREYTLDDFYSVQLDKMERYVCLKASGVTIDEGEESSSSDGDESGEDDDDDSDYDGDTVYSDDGASTIVAEEGDGEEGEHQKDKLEIVVEDEAEIEPEVVADVRGFLHCLQRAITTDNPSLSARPA